MIITLTPAQYIELTNALWAVDYQVTLGDGTVINANTGDDDLAELPDAVVLLDVDNPGNITDTDGNLAGYAFAHPDLTWEDDVILLAILDGRVEATTAIAALPPAERAAARQELRQTIRTAARQDARREARRIARQTNRREARRLWRIEHRNQYAAELAARQAELTTEP